MIKIRILLRTAACAVFMLSALAFAAVEGWLLFSGDWKLFENDALALIQLVVRILLCLYCFAITLRAVLRRKPSFLWEGVQLLGITVAATPFMSNYLGVPFIAFAVLFLISEPQGIAR